MVSRLPLPERISLLGPGKDECHHANAGTQHNVIPDRCTFVVDIRSNECYTNQELFDEIRKHISCEAKARSFRLALHTFRRTTRWCGRPLLWDGCPSALPHCPTRHLMPFPSMKMGPGKSSRSHTADEFIFVKEIEEAITLYLELLDGAEI